MHDVAQIGNNRSDDVPNTWRTHTWQSCKCDGRIRDVAQSVQGVLQVHTQARRTLVRKAYALVLDACEVWA